MGTQVLELDCTAELLEFSTEDGAGKSYNDNLIEFAFLERRKSSKIMADARSLYNFLAAQDMFSVETALDIVCAQGDPDMLFKENM